MSLVRSFYAPLFGACAVVGGCMEVFMLKTGFYEKCVPFALLLAPCCTDPE